MPDTTPDNDARWLRRALELAAQGRYGVSPNPMVGAVVVDHAGRAVGEGYHAECGGPHAEVVALREAGGRAVGSSLYVSLEPCAHHGRTPPCVDAIVKAGIRRVVIAMRDPNPPAAGGLDRLRAEGVDVSIGGESDRARALNRKWMTWAQERRPWVTLKAGTSLDGKIATRTGRSKWITGEAARHRSLELREENDAILVGVETVIADNPRLTRRLGLNRTGQWLRIVLDSHLRTPADSIVVCSDPDQTLIVHAPDAPHDRRRRFATAGVHLMEIDSDPSARIEIRTLLANLARKNVTSLLVEGGATVHGSFVDTDLVDEVIFFVAPMLIGGPGQPAVAGRGVADLELAPRLRFEGVDRHGDDLEIRATRAEEENVHRSG